MSTIAANHRRSNAHRHLVVVPGAMPEATSRPQPRWARLVLRLAVTADEPQLRRLAHLDSARPLSGPALLAEQAGSVIAAVSLHDGAVIADPFVASADGVAMLRLRAAQLKSADGVA